MKPSANRVFRIPPRTPANAGVKPEHWKPAIRAQHRVVAKHSWWTDFAAPDSREGFIEAATARHLEREHKLNATEAKRLALGIGLWGKR